MTSSVTAPAFEDVSVGDEAPPLVVENLSRTHFVRYAGASGDFNPMHHDDTVATSIGNPSVFGHGMLTAGLMARVAQGLVRAEPRSGRYQVRFSKQVWPGETLTFTATVMGVRDAEDGDVGLVDVELSGRQPGRRGEADRRRDRRRPEASADPRVGLLDGQSRSSPGRVAASAASSHCRMAEEGAKARRERRRRQPRRPGHRRGPGRAGMQGDRGARRSRRSRATTRSPTSTAPERSSRPRSTRSAQIDILVNNAGIVRDRTLREDERGRLRRRHRRAPEGLVQLRSPRRRRR